MHAASRFGLGSAPSVPAKAVPLPHKPAPRLQAIARSKPASRPASGDDTAPISISMHGRHMDVDEETRGHVTQRIHKLAHDMEGTTVEGVANGVQSADIKLTPSSVHISIIPVHLKPTQHSSFLRNGEMHAHVVLPECGRRHTCDARQAFDLAFAQLEKKLHTWKKSTAEKVSYKDAFKRN